MLIKSFATMVVAMAMFASNTANAEKPTPVTIVDPVVSVEVSNADPIPVSVISAAQQPYTFQASCQSNNTNACSVETDPVPTGKRLALHFVNGSVQLFGAASQVQGFRLSVGQNIWTLPPRPVSSFSGLVNFAVNEPVLIFVDAGQKVIVSFSSTEIRIIATVTLTGYLVDAN